MTQEPSQEKPQIEFPCAYPIKVMGLHEDGFRDCIFDVIHRHAPGFDQETIVYRESSGGRYISVTITITATGLDQLKALFEDLKATGRVAMVL
jgi:putative lipoic acid-binding regulatory protein